MQKFILFVFSCCVIFSLNAQTFNGTGGAIPDNGATATCFPITVTGVGTINGSFGLASLCINISHTWDEDLEIKLQAPDGTLIPISIQNGGSGQNYTNTCFTANATIAIGVGTAPFTGNYIPDGPLGNVNNGQNASGVWSLCIQDIFGSFTGTLNSWSISFTSTPIQPIVIPVNDDPCTAITLPVSNTCSYTNFTNVGASSTSGAPAPGCAGYQGNDVWFQVTVPAGGLLIFDTQVGTMTDGGMAIYSGASCSALTLISCDDQSSPNGSMPKITAGGLTPGSTVWIRMWSWNNSNNGTFGICVTSVPPVTNDEPCTATTLTANPSCTYTTFTNQGATATPGVTAPGCASYQGADVWFQVNVPSTGSITIDTQTGGITDGGMAIYSGTSCSALTLLNCDDDGSNNGSMPEIIATGLVPGSTVWIRVWRYGSAIGGTFGICVTYPVPPPSCGGNAPAGNTCAEATPVCNFNGYCGSTSSTYTANTWPELTAAFSSCLSGATIENNSFISFVASATTASFNVWVPTSQNGDGIQMMFYDGGCGSGPVTCYGGYNNILNGPTLVSANGLIPGNTYYLMIDGYAGDVCDYIFDPVSGVNVLNVIGTGISGTGNPITIGPGGIDICVGGSVTLTASGGNGIYSWSPATGLSATSGASVTASPTGTTVYTVVSTGVGDCPVTISRQVSVNIIPTPLAPTITPVVLCQGASATQLTAGGVNLQWYTSANGGNGSSNAPIPSTATIGTVTYYVSQSSGTCEGPRAAITVTVSPRPALPTVPGLVRYCQNAIAVPLTATGTNVLWYTAATGGTGVTSAPTPVTTAAGNFTYYVTQTPIGSCESARNPILVKIDAKTTSNTPIILCPAQLPYNWNGNILTTAGTYKDTLINNAGCDSLLTLVLSVGTSTITTTNLGLCPVQFPYTWPGNGQIITTAATYRDTLPGSFGCDSISILIVIAKTPTVSTTNRSVCSSAFPYSWNGNSYATAGTYKDTLVNAAGCDSVLTLVLTVKASSVSTTSINVCPGSFPYIWNGFTYNSAGTYRDTLVNAAGCDSITTLILTLRSTSSSTTVKNLCPSQLPVTFNGFGYSAPGTYTATLTNATGCDSIATLFLTVKAISTSTTNVSICATTLPYSWNGKIYNLQGTFKDTLVNAAGCDSIVTLILKVNATTGSSTPVTVCPVQLPYSWNGNSYFAAGTYKDTLLNAAGCDSFVTLVLTVSLNSLTTTNVSLCPSQFPYVWHSRSLTTAGIYRDTLLGSSGCDSITVLNLIQKLASSSNTAISICPVALPYSWNGNSYAAAGTYKDTLVNAVGCDSVVTLLLALRAVTTSTTPVSICPAALPYSWNGNTYLTAGNFKDTLVNAAGCDSIITLLLTLKVVTSSTTPVSICPSALPYSWNGTSYLIAGTFKDTLVNAAGCDSVATLVLTVKAASSSSTPLTICPRQLPYSWNGNTYNTAGIYKDTLPNAASCDSVVTLVLTVTPNSNSTTTVRLCPSQFPYSWHSRSLSIAGTYNDTLLASSGCDSITTLILIQKATSSSNTALSICPSQLPYNWNSTSYTGAGTFNVTLVNAAGCDSVATLVLTVKLVTSSTTTLAICQAQLPYSWNGNSYAGAGTFKDTLVNAAGCDSIVTLNLSLTPLIVTNNSISLCPSQLPYSWNTQTIIAAGTYTDTLPTAAGCDSVSNLTITIKAISSSTTAVAVCPSQLPYSWNGNNYNGAGTFNVTLVNAVVCDSITTLVLTMKANSNSTTPVSVCPSQLPYSWNGNNYNAAGTYNVTLVNAAGCDSIAKLVLTVRATSSSSTAITVCNALLPYSWNGSNFNAPGSYPVTLVNSVGCDSIATLVLTVTTYLRDTTRVSICPSQLPYAWATYSITAAGNYSDTLTASTGCDSISILVLKVKVNTTSTTRVGVCPVQVPYSWNGNSYNAAGTYIVTLVNAAGCDSSATLILTFKQPTASSTPITVCPAQLPYRWNSNTYNGAGTYAVTLVNAAGCDSVATLVVTVKLNTTSTTSSIICPSQLPYSWNGQSYAGAGTYNVALTNAIGCDSIATLQLTVKVNSSSSTLVSICPLSLPYSWNGTNYTASGSYSIKLTNAVGCDSTATLVLRVKTNTSSSTNQVICENELPYIWNGNSYTASGTYRANLTNAAGCDSAATLVLSVKPLPVFSLGRDTTLCPGITLPLSPGDYTRYLWQDFSTAPIYTVTRQGLYTVTVTSSEGCKGTSGISVVYFDNCNDIVFPSAITPNGDGNNDKFGPIGNLSVVSNYRLTVYNRYGQLVFNSTNPYQKWDGLFKSTIIGNLSYVWMAEYMLNGKVRKIQKGSVLIIK